MKGTLRFFIYICGGRWCRSVNSHESMLCEASKSVHRIFFPQNTATKKPRK